MSSKLNTTEPTTNRMAKLAQHYKKKGLAIKCYKSQLKSLWQTEKRGKIGIGRTTAAIFASFILSLSINIAMSVLLPLETNNRLTIAMMLMIPIWVGLAFYCLLMRNALVAWVKTLALASVLFILTWIFGF